MGAVRVLIADDDAEVRETYVALLREVGHDADGAADGTEVLERVRAKQYDLVLQDFVFPPTDGLTLLREVKSVRPTALVVVMTGFATVENVIESYRAGSFDFVLKPVDGDKLLELVARAGEIRNLGEKRRRLAEELESERHQVIQLRQQLADRDPFRRIVGHSQSVARLIDTVREVARTDSTVLITGESGTGKGLMARTIHEASARGEGPFVEANCVVYSEGVLHSELFGHEKGAFTGAGRTKKGRFELARGGTLFLDEIGEIQQSTQLMLLRVLQDRTFERVGGEETIEADVRLIAATNRDLKRAIDTGQFRSDLFYRLTVIPLHLPALREHPEDVPVLAQHFLEQCATRLGRTVDGFAPDAAEALTRHHWPGNVRELENLIERIVVLNRTGRIEIGDLPPEIGGAGPSSSGSSSPGTLQALERQRIVEALRDAAGNKKRAAVALGIHRSTLYAKLKRYGLDDDEGVGSRDDAELASESETLVTTS